MQQQIFYSVFLGSLCKYAVNLSGVNRNMGINGQDHNVGNSDFDFNAETLRLLPI